MNIEEIMDQLRIEDYIGNYSSEEESDYSEESYVNVAPNRNVIIPDLSGNPNYYKDDRGSYRPVTDLTQDNSQYDAAMQVDKPNNQIVPANFQTGESSRPPEEVKNEWWGQFGNAQKGRIIFPDELFGTRKTRRPTRNRKPNYEGRNQIPYKYTPKESEYQYQDNYLNLDCVVSPDREIDGFFKNMRLVVALNRENFASTDLIDHYLEHHMTGNAAKWFNSTEGAAKKAEAKGLLNTDPLFSNLTDTEKKLAYLDVLNRMFRQTFTGYSLDRNNELSTQARFLEKARYGLSRIQLCNICFWKNFSCEYEKYYYSLPTEEQSKYNDEFFRKLPPLWMEEMQKTWPSKPAYIADNLSGRILFLKEAIEKRCKEREFTNSTSEYMQNVPCCDPNLLDIAGRYGCGPRSQPRRKPQKYHRRKKYRRFTPKYRKYKKHRKHPQHYEKPRYRKRRYRKPFQKKDFCPSGKKTCKCWLCKEEGHYANECPNKTKYKEQNKVIEQIYSIGMEPIESDNESQYSEYEIEFEIETKSFASNDEISSEWEEIEDSDTESSEEDNYEWKVANKRTYKNKPKA